MPIEFPSLSQAEQQVAILRRLFHKQLGPWAMDLLSLDRDCGRSPAWTVAPPISLPAEAQASPAPRFWRRAA